MIFTYFRGQILFCLSRKAQNWSNLPKFCKGACWERLERVANWNMLHKSFRLFSVVICLRWDGTESLYDDDFANLPGGSSSCKGFGWDWTCRRLWSTWNNLCHWRMMIKIVTNKEKEKDKNCLWSTRNNLCHWRMMIKIVTQKRKRERK